MGVSSNTKKPKHQKQMSGEKKKDDQGAITKKPWAESSTADKIKGVTITAAAGALLYGALKA
jgi:hypothetical protein